MAVTQATGLLLPKQDDPNRPDQHPGYLPFRVSVGTHIPGAPEGDATANQPDPLDDEMADGHRLGAVAPPLHVFLRGFRGTRTQAHSFMFIPLVRYTAVNPRYRSVILPTALDDAALGQPDPLDDEVFSESASDGERFAEDLVGGGRGARQAHDPAQQLSDSEQSATGATGIWSIGGRV